jgi:hypothetical protein
MFGEGNGRSAQYFPSMARQPRTADGRRVPAFWLFQFAFADTCSTITSAPWWDTGSGDLLTRSACPDSSTRLRSLGVGSGRLARQHDTGFPQQLHGRDRVPRLRGLDRGAHRRWVHRARRRDRPGPAARSQVQAGRWGAPPPSRPDDRGHRRCDLVVRLVRVQPGVDALGARPRGHRAGRRQHDARQAPAA